MPQLRRVVSNPVADDSTRVAAFQPMSPVRLTAGGAQAPVFCLPAWGGSAIGYVQLASRLPAERPVFAFESPGLEGDRPPLESIHQLAEEFAAALLRTPPDGPCHLLGWSVGGVLAFEVALRLLAADRPVGTLALIDPSVIGQRVALTEPIVAHAFLWHLAADSMAEIDSIDGLAELARPGDVSPVFEAMTSVGLLPADMDLQVLHDRYQVFRANTYALAEYDPSGRFPDAALFIKAEESPATTAGWLPLLGELREHRLPGDHYSIMRGDALTEVARLVAAGLAEYD